MYIYLFNFCFVLFVVEMLWNDIGVMFYDGQDNFIFFGEVIFVQFIRDQIDCFGCGFGKNNFVDGFSIQKLLDFFLGSFVVVSGCVGKIM